MCSTCKQGCLRPSLYRGLAPSTTPTSLNPELSSSSHQSGSCFHPESDTLRHSNLQTRPIWHRCRLGRGSNGSQQGDRRGGGAVVGCLEICVSVCVTADWWYSDNRHTWCVGSSQSGRWEERSPVGLLPPISAQQTTGDIWLYFFLFSFWLFLLLFVLPHWELLHTLNTPEGNLHFGIWLAVC